MKNVTIALDDETYEAGRNYARDHRTSLNALIRRLLEQTVRHESSVDAWQRFFALADRSGGNSRGQRWRREDLYRE